MLVCSEKLSCALVIRLPSHLYVRAVEAFNFWVGSAQLAHCERPSPFFTCTVHALMLHVAQQSFTSLSATPVRETAKATL